MTEGGLETAPPWEKRNAPQCEGFQSCDRSPPSCCRSTSSRALRVVFENRRSADALDVFNRGREPDRACDVWRASFEPVRWFLECALFERDTYDHSATAVPRRHGIQKLRASVKRTDTSRSTHLMS